MKLPIYVCLNGKCSFFAREFKLDAHVAGNFDGFLFPSNSGFWVIEQKSLAVWVKSTIFDAWLRKKATLIFWWLTTNYRILKGPGVQEK